jgi:hypothetical protein
MVSWTSRWSKIRLFGRAAAVDFVWFGAWDRPGRGFVFDDELVVGHFRVQLPGRGALASGVGHFGGLTVLSD